MAHEPIYFPLGLVAVRGAEAIKRFAQVEVVETSSFSLLSHTESAKDVHETELPLPCNPEIGLMLLGAFSPPGSCFRTSLVCMGTCWE